MTTKKNQQNKQLVQNFWRELENPDGAHQDADFGAFLAEDCVWHGPDPINQLNGRRALVHGYLQPLRESFPDLRRQTHIFMAGQSNGRADGTGDGHMWVAGTGYLTGTFRKDYLTIPANGKTVRIRWGEFCKIEDGRIVEIFVLLDLIDLMQQAGCNVLPPSRGKDGLYPPPAAGDGVMLEPQDDDTSQHTLEHIRRFIFEGLNSYDQSDLKSMGIANFFTPDIKWYGPGGIGACLSLKQFEQMHQIPWLRAFPDRTVQNLDALIAEGSYSGAPGWAGVIATHAGPYLDCPATGKRVVVNGLDFWNLHDDMYIENWVFVDMIHLFRQFGVDLLARIAR